MFFCNFSIAKIYGQTRTLRETHYELKQAEKKANILEGLLVVENNFNEIIALIINSKTPEETINSLIMNFELTEFQAKAILDLRLQELSGLEYEKIKQEYEELMKFIMHLKQISSDEVFYSNKQKEKVNLLTDRTLYVSGEKIRFSVLVQSLNGQNNNNQSRIIYIELITNIGEKILGGKYQVIFDKCYGAFKIPENASTGIYYLRAYTKLMRNDIPENYSYVEIKIIDALNKNNFIRSSKNGTSDSRVLSFNDSLYTDSHAINTNKKIYSKREKVNVLLDEKYFENKDSKLICLSVIPVNSLLLQKFEFVNSKRITENKFYSEVKGIILSGKVKGKETTNDLKNVLVNLSILGENQDFRAIYTNDLGRFNFILPNLYGSQDIFLSANDDNNAELEILVDNDFCTNSIALPNSKFNLTKSERNLIYDFAMKKQIENQYINEISTKDSSLTFNKYFYSEPNEVLYLDKYIQLPTLEECFAELPSSVKVRKKKAKKYIKITGTQSEMEIFSPLLLVDRIAVYDVNKLLSASPKGVDRIEIINVPYIKGEMIYGGVISIISKNDDFAGIELPSSGLYINYNFFEKNTESQIPESKNINLPDIRNTLYWIPDLRINNFKEISFKTADSPGNYIIVVRSINSKGDVDIINSKFKVLSN